MKGGYVNVDASGLDVAKTENQTIKGIYKKLLDAKKADKPVFLYNVVAGDSGKFSPIVVFCSFASDGETIVCNFATLQINVDKNDEVTIRK